MPHVAEIAPDIYRICVFYPELNLQFNHFLVKDEEPLLFHTGLRRMFPEVREGVAKVLDPAHLRWISWSHFESDECGSLNEWLTIAPHAQPACGMVGALVNVNDFSSREARILAPRTCSQPESIASATTTLRSYPTGGTRVSCLKKPTPPYFAPICSTTTATSSLSHTVASSSVSANR